jgi:hypothetical protein
MNEEAKEQEEQKPPEQKPPAEEKAPEQKPPAEAAAEKKEEKKKKINRMALKELEKKIQEVKEKMGSLSSSYARHLLSRKEELLQEKEPKQGGPDATDTEKSVQ